MKQSADQRNNDPDRAVKKSISAPGSLFALAQIKQRGQRFATFSDYVQDLMRRDTMELGIASGRR